ncbi:MAG TPA: FAD-binding oxidoreductase [Acidimicrobiia bacterium]|nr:FAD-binding oxidoreductase [Acidimicrobiia bacterium]
MTLTPATVSEFAARLVGTVLLPDHEGYDDARRGFNTLHDHRPALIVRPADSDDVAGAIRFAKDVGLEIAVRSGGHSIAGYGTVDGGLVIDLSTMRSIEIDEAESMAWVEAGVTAGQFTSASTAAGLVTPFGDSGDVGVGGITLGGGVGWLSRSLGLTIDSLMAVEVVTADGSTLAASETDHPDLFWAVRGGGGNFGVVTRFLFRLHPIDTVLGGILMLPASPEIVRRLVDLAAAAPDELTMISLVMRIPPFSIVPVESHGKLGIFITLVWSGDLEAGESVLRRFRDLGPPIADLIRPMPYAEMYELMPEAPASVTFVTRNLMGDELDDRAIEAILAHMEPALLPSDESLAAVEIRVLGGAIARIPIEATAFAHRHRKIIASVVAAGFDPNEGDSHRAWVESLYRAVSHLADGVYVNFLDVDGETRIGEAYPESTLRRLTDVKRRYDPTNLFHRNLNVRP